MRALFLFSILALILCFSPASVADDEPVWDGFTFDLENLQGDDVSETDVFADGKLYLVDFWASWCRPCSQYLPQLEKMAEDYSDRGFEVVIFCVDEASTISTARATLEGEDYPFTILFDPEKAVQDELGARRIPTTVLFDPEGNELWRHVGYASGDEKDVREKIEANLPEEAETDSGE